MGHAIETECYNCDAYLGHLTHKTDPNNYHRTDLVEMLKENSRKDMSFRIRTKWCEKCKTHFNTVEMRHGDLRSLIILINNYKKELKNAHEKISALKDENQHNAMYKKMYEDEVTKSAKNKNFKALLNLKRVKEAWLVEKNQNLTKKLNKLEKKVTISKYKKRKNK